MGVAVGVPSALGFFSRLVPLCSHWRLLVDLQNLKVYDRLFGMIDPEMMSMMIWRAIRRQLGV